MPKPRLGQTILKKLLHYEPKTGAFIWLPRGDRRWDSRHAGKSAGYLWRARALGVAYRMIGIFGYPFYAHRLAWLYMTGKWPTKQVDHTDGDGLNNRWNNLRQATNSQNHANIGPRRDNTVGLKGVTRVRGKRFQAQITVRGNVRYLGTFKTPEESHAVYHAAAMGAFGKFARMK